MLIFGAPAFRLSLNWAVRCCARARQQIRKSSFRFTFASLKPRKSGSSSNRREIAKERSYSSARHPEQRNDPAHRSADDAGDGKPLSASLDAGLADLVVA